MNELIILYGLIGTFIGFRSLHSAPPGANGPAEILFCLTLIVLWPVWLIALARTSK